MTSVPSGEVWTEDVVFSLEMDVFFQSARIHFVMQIYVDAKTCLKSFPHIVIHDLLYLSTPVNTSVSTRTVVYLKVKHSAYRPAYKTACVDLGLEAEHDVYGN